MVRILLILLLTFYSTNAFAYGALKKKGKNSLYNTQIIRGNDEFVGMRNDITYKFGVTDYLTITGETSLLIAGNSQRTGFGFNYQQFGFGIQLYRSEDVALSVGFEYRTEGKVSHMAEYLYSSAGNKFTGNIGFDIFIDKDNTLLAKLEVRQYDKFNYQRTRICLEYLTKITQDFSMKFYFWNAFYSNRTGSKGWTIYEATAHFQATKNLNIGAGVSYYMRHEDTKYAFNNFSIITLLSFNFE